jgi:hypothetical protein
MKKQFTSVQTAYTRILPAIAAVLLVPFYAYAASNNSIQALLSNVSLFISEVLIPVLFSIAFLFFLVNMVKYFIIGGANEEDRAKGKKNVLYSLIAFVFLISIWSIVTLLVNGLGIQNDDAICPDYLQGACGDDINYNTGTSGGFGTATFPGAGGGTAGSGTGNSSPGTGGGTGSASNGSSGGSSGSGTPGAGSNSNFGGLAELVFGTGKDSALFTESAGGPRAIYQTPTISPTASCEMGLNTLLLANTIETTQAAFALYKDAAGTTRWANLTDLHSANHVTYDKDTLDALLGSNISKLHVINTHQNTRTENLDLIMQGHGPSAADMSAMCNNNDLRITYAIVDWNGIWTMTQQADTCPYSVAARNILPLLETYVAMASLEATTRAPELATYNTDSVTPAQYQNHFADIDTQEFSSLAPEEVLALSNYYQTYASTTITYAQVTDAFCNAF